MPFAALRFVTGHGIAVLDLERVEVRVVTDNFPEFSRLWMQVRVALSKIYQKRRLLRTGQFVRLS